MRRATSTPFLVLLLIIICFPSSGEVGAGEFVRKPAVAGAFYPSEPGVLERFVKRAVSAAPAVPVRKGDIVGVISPHAGYIYSGSTAGKAFGLLRGNRYDLVVLIGPSHFVRLGGVAVFSGRAFATPLGNVEVDRTAIRRILEGNTRFIREGTEFFAREHSLEVQLPFLQVVLGSFKLVPIEVNTLDVSLLDKVSRVIAGAVEGKRVLVVATSDLSHYRPRSVGEKLDHRLIRALESFDPVRLAEMLTRGVCEACGGGALVLGLLTMEKLGASKVYVVDYSDSGDTTGDISSVVGYVSAVVVGSLKGGEKGRREKMSGHNLKGPEYLTVGEKEELLRIARRTIEEYLNSGKMPKIEVSNPRLEQRGAAFVTLEKGGRLRGCIGYTEARFPLYQTVMECAIAAATEDPRFPPVTPGELKDIEIEISVLTPLRKVKDISEIEVGRHGLMVVKGFQRGLLLPQVPVEYGWDRETFLSQTCLKAGLPPDEWKKGIEIYSFEAEVFGESDLGR